MSRRIIRNLLESRVATWAAGQVPAWPVTWENVTTASTQTKPYLRVFLLPADTSAPDLAGAIREYTGVFQVTGVFARGIGTGAAEDFEAAMNTLFPVNLRLTSGAVTVQTLTPVSAPAPIEEEDALSLAVSFRYQADVV